MKYFIYASIFLFTLKNLHAQSFASAAALAHLDAIRNTNGVAVADYDRDGDLDLFFTGILNFEPADPNTWSHLMRNKGDGTFEDVTMAAGLTFNSSMRG